MPKTRDEEFTMSALLLKAEKCGEHACHYLRQFMHVVPKDWEAKIAVDAARAAATFARLFLDMYETPGDECGNCKATRWDHSPEQWEYCENRLLEKFVAELSSPSR